MSVTSFVSTALHSLAGTVNTSTGVNPPSVITSMPAVKASEKIEMNENKFHRLSPAARELFQRVSLATSGSGGGVPLREGEARAAEELVRQELCFYSMDYDHLQPYSSRPRTGDGA